MTTRAINVTPSRYEPSGNHFTWMVGHQELRMGGNDVTIAKLTEVLMRPDIWISLTAVSRVASLDTDEFRAMFEDALEARVQEHLAARAYEAAQVRSNQAANDLYAKLTELR